MKTIPFLVAALLSSAGSVFGQSFPISPFDHDASDVDVAYDLTNDVYLVVWRQEFGPTNVQIMAQRVDSRGNLVGGNISVSFGGVAERPRVCNVAGRNRFVVCWQVSSSVGWSVRLASVAAADGSLQPAQFSFGSNSTEPQPIVSGSQLGFDDRAVLAYRVGSRVHLSSLRVEANGDLTAAGTNGIDTGAPNPEIAISKSAGALRRRLLVWRNLDALPPVRHTVWGVVVDRLAGFMSVPRSVYSSPNLIARPAVDGDGTDFLVAWDEEEGALSRKRDIGCQMLRFDSATNILQTVGAPGSISATSGRDESTPAVSLLGPKYLIAWEQESSLLARSSVAGMFHPAGCQPCGGFLSLVTTLGSGGTRGVASRRSGGHRDDDALIAYEVRGIGGLRRVYGRLAEAIGAGGPVVDLGGGCTGGGTASANGPFAIGNPDFAFDLTGADTQATIVAFGWNVQVPLVPCGPCQMLPPLTLIPTVTHNGRASLALPPPCDPTLIGGTLQMQWWILGTGPTQCLVPGLTFSNVLRATIGE